jgi:uncharacterized membrane protein YeiH
VLQSWLAQFGFRALGAFTIIDLIAATTNAFNGALLARRPDHYKHYTVVGIILLAVLGGITGGVVRDVLVNSIPAALTNPWYLILCILAAGLALTVAYSTGQRFRDGVFQFFTAFSLPWYAVVGAQKGLATHLPLIAVILLGVVGPTAGRYLIDVSSLVPPKHFVRGEWFVGTAVLATVLYIVLYKLGLSLWPATLITVAFAFAFRLAALFLTWEEPEPWEPPEAKAGEPERKPLGKTLHEEFTSDQQAHPEPG